MPNSPLLILASARHKDEGHSYYVADLRRITPDEALAISQQANQQAIGDGYVSVSREVEQVLAAIGSQEGNIRRSHERLMLCGLGRLTSAQQASLIAFLTERLESWEQLRHQPHGEACAWNIQSDIIAQWEREAMSFLQGRSSKPGEASQTTASATQPTSRRKARALRTCLIFTIVIVLVVISLGYFGGRALNRVFTPQLTTREELKELEATDSTAFLRNPLWEGLAKATGLPSQPSQQAFSAWLLQVHRQYRPWQRLQGEPMMQQLQQALTKDDVAQRMAAAALHPLAANALQAWPETITQPECLAARNSLSSLAYALPLWRSSAPSEPLPTAALVALIQDWTSAVTAYASRSDLHPSLGSACERLHQRLAQLPTEDAAFSNTLTAVALLRWQAVTHFLFEEEAVAEAFLSITDVKAFAQGGRFPEDWRPRFELLKAGSNSPLVTAAEVQLLSMLKKAVRPAE